MTRPYRFRHPRPEPHVHRFILPSIGAQVKGVCACGEVKLFCNSFSVAVELGFVRNKAGILDNLARQSRAARGEVLTEDVPLSMMAENWRKGE